MGLGAIVFSKSFKKPDRLYNEDTLELYRGAYWLQPHFQYTNYNQ